MNCLRIFFLIIFFISGVLTAQNRQIPVPEQKTLYTTETNTPPSIDGIPDEEIWQQTDTATNFVMYSPGDGDPSRSTHPTEVKILYDNEAIYVAAYMFDNEPHRIMRQFTQRDNIEQSDYFTFDVNTYNDGENQTRFIVTSAGTQADAKMSGEREDYSYNVVWEAETSFDANGWYAEIKIPYAALRFPKKEKQLWSIQFFRRIEHLNEEYVWNYIDKSRGKSTQYNGLLRGIENIDPPLRLSFYPYTSGEIESYNGNINNRFSAGMDVKYGINDAFTLDATLIPDFGQAAFDDVELNLGPFEQTFGENRAFFTEGTELFNKGNLFYSRRVGDTPVNYSNLRNSLLVNEEVIENPEEVNLLNAVKVSGRTERGLGIGFFNSVTRETQAIVRDSVTGILRRVTTEPLANYNIFVLDQQFNQNSSITLINTNVTRDRHFRDGNVTGFLFDVFNRSNSFNFAGDAKVSNVNLTGQNITGFGSNFSVNRTKGNFRYGISHEFANETYDINDLGVNFTNNYNNFYWETSYRIFEPRGNFNNYNIRIYGNHLRRYRPNVETGTGVGGNFFAMTRKRFAFGGFLEVNSASKDFFEPRREGYFVTYNKNIGGDFWVSSDYRKKFAYDVRLGYRDFFDSNQESLNLRISPRFRFNEKFLLIYDLGYSYENNRHSFVRLLPRDIIFGERDMESVENSIRANYNFNTKQALNLSFRNFWSVASFDENLFTILEDSGSLTSTSYAYNRENDPNTNFNIWNLDLSYRWQFAPGSEAILLYRNSIFNQDNLSELAFQHSLGKLFVQPIQQILSLRIVYFLDYNNIKNVLKS